MAILDALEAGLAGDYDAARAALARCDQAVDPLSRASACALRAWIALAMPDGCAAPSIAEVAAFAAAPIEARRAASRACALMEWAAFVSLDARGIASWVEVHRAMSGDDGDDGARARLAIAESMLAFLDGDPDRSFELASGASQIATRARLAGAVVDSASLRALALLARGELDAATAVARRAARMARSEGLVLEEWLSGIVLARMRRHEGKAHLAARILTALERVVPPAFGRILSWESALAGLAIAPHPPASLVRALLDAARGGARDEMITRARELDGELAGLAPLAAESRAIVEALDPATESADPFAHGVSTRTPVGVVDPEEAGGTTAYVLAVPGRAPRRILRAGLGLARDAVVVRDPRTKDARPISALAVLALAGREGMTIDRLFESIYGFGYASAKHEGLLRVVLHRARAEVKDVAEIVRRGEHVALAIGRPLAVPDPRCGRPIESRVLSIVASAPGVTARDAAGTLGLPLRTVQLALQVLVDDGACAVDRDGARVAYVVEDTTFGRPTTARLRAPGALGSR